MNGEVLLGLLTAILVVVALAVGAPVLLYDKLKDRPALAFGGQALASGVFLGAGLVHMLPDAAKGFAASRSGYPWPFALCGGVVLALALLERLGVTGDIEDGEASALPLIATLVLAIHSLLAGAALGASTTTAAIVVLFVALIAHKGAASLSLALMLARSRLTRLHAVAAFLSFVFCLPLGVVAGHLALQEERTIPLAAPTIMALGAGAFLYLGTLHGRSRGHRSLGALTMTIAGFSLMALIAAIT